VPSTAFEPYGGQAQDYARASRWLDASCENEVVALLSELRRSARAASPQGVGPDERLDAEQNAVVVKNAERYYRAMVRGGPESWNGPRPSHGRGPSSG
jgi:erythromycin esterase-like protein